MKVIIAGSRTIVDFGVSHVIAAIKESKFKITEIISGGAKGIDWCGETYAKANDIPLKIFHANWNRYGRAAGSIRNTEMAKYADALIAIWDGKSKGTENMISQMISLGKPVYVHKITEEKK